MDTTDMRALLPLLLLAATAIVVMLGIAAKRSHALAAWLTLAGLTAAFFSIFAAAPLAPRQVTSLLVVDRYALFYIGLIIASAAVVAVLSYRYLENHDGHREELYLLLLLATLGCSVLVASNHLASFVLGLEILSVSLYAMVAYLKDREVALEAGIKYLILASASAAFLLFGSALIYAATGSMEFSRIQAVSINDSGLALLLPGIALTVAGIGFKLGVVPFHLWTPDVYEGAPAPVAAFVATTSKTAMVALLLRYGYVSGALEYPRCVLGLRRHRDCLDVRWQPPRAAAEQCQTHFGLLLDRPLRIHIGGLSGGRDDGDCGGEFLSGRVHRNHPGGIWSRDCSFRLRAGRRRSGGLPRPFLAAARCSPGPLLLLCFR